MKVSDMVKNAPNPVLVICGTVIAVALLGSFVFLINAEKETKELTALINVILNLAMLLLGGGGFIAAASAAKSAEQAAVQTDGELDQRVQDAVSQALQDYGSTSVRSGNPAGHEIERRY